MTSFRFAASAESLFPKGILKGIFLMLCLCLGGGGTAFAGIEWTAHDPEEGGFISLAEGGKCSACHIPHGAQGKRLWPTQPSTAPTNYVGDVAVLCGYCHNYIGGSGLVNSASDDFVYGNLSHGVIMSYDPVPYGHVDASVLPYVSGASDGVIECTSCHNVHDDTYRPFLRSDINTLCAMCHGDRLFAGGVIKSGNAILGSAAFAWGASASYMGLNNPGSHPVGTDVSADQGSDSPITLPGFFNEPKSNLPGQWSLGGHRVDGGTGGVVCITCHAVHGLDEDPQEAAALGVVDITPNVNFLTLPQSSASLGPIGRDVANGSGEPNNLLCEACHQGVDPAANYASDNALVDTGTPLVHLFANPGATSFGHPVDNMVSISGTAWVSDLPPDWPIGSETVHDPGLICESCHAPHPYADRARADLSNANGGAGIAGTADTNYILRGVQATVCSDCHGGTLSDTAHHPIGITFRNDGVLYLNGTGSTAGIEALKCITCHSGVAHNWPYYSQLAMDPAWIPLDNGRGSFFAASTSQSCIDCHYSLDVSSDPAGENDSPTKHDGVLPHYTSAGRDAGYDVIGRGTHFLGPTTSSTWAALVPAFAVTQQAWSVVGGSAGRSRFGGSAAAPVVICESCHELQPSLNSGKGRHLLLMQYFDGANGGEGGPVAGRDELCEGCHLPPGSHPMTGDTVSRTAAPLSVDISVDWLKAPTDASYGATWADPNPTIGADPDLLSCDGCHQVHDANSGGLTYILDAKDGSVVTGSTVQPTASGYPADAFPVRHVNGNAVISDFCGSCHPYR